MNQDVKKNLCTYLFFILVAVAGMFYGSRIAGLFANLRLWQWENILLLIPGIPFIFFQRKAGLPDFWEQDISAKTRFLIPLATGIGFGLLDLLVFKIILHPQSYVEWPPFLQPFPYSVFLYFSGAFEIEVFYRLIPLTIILALGKAYKNGKYFTGFFWLAVILTSLREPLEQLPAGGVAVIGYSLLTGFLMNFLQAIFYKKSGFLSSFVLRLGHYLIWHILLGVYVQFVELAVKL